MSLRLLLLASVAVASPASATSPDERAVAHSVESFVAAVNTGQQKAALRHFTSDVSITEDLPPYRWQGAHAGTDWLEAMFRNGEKMGMTSILMHLQKPTRVEVSGDSAYEIIPGVVTLKGSGRSLQESGSLTFALRKLDGNWRIAAFAWTGERAH